MINQEMDERSYSIEEQQKNKGNGLFRVKAGLFLACSAGIGLLAGFGGAIATTRRQDPKSFDVGIIGPRQSVNTPPSTPKNLHQTGAALATRALAYGTAYAIAGCSILFFGIWKLSGAKDLADFRQRAGSVLPRIPKKDNPNERKEFSGLNDFIQYIIDKDEEEKIAKTKEGTSNKRLQNEERT